MRLVVIGNGMVGHRFLEAWTDRPESKSWETVCFGEEAHAAYDRIHLTEYFGHRDASPVSEASACRNVAASSFPSASRRSC